VSPRGTFTQKSSSTTRTYYNGATFTAKAPSWYNSPRPRSRIRPYYIVPIYALQHGQVVPSCNTGYFRFGSDCRPCSSDPCPVGQYRIPCTEGTNSYCTLCTNKPNTSDLVYYTPGNDNDCLYMSCNEDLCPSYTSNEPVNISFILEFPVSQSDFQASQTRITDTLSGVGSVPRSAVSVTSASGVSGSLSAGSTRSVKAGRGEGRGPAVVLGHGRHLLQSETNQSSTPSNPEFATGTQSTTPSPETSSAGSTGTSAGV